MTHLSNATISSLQNTDKINYANCRDNPDAVFTLSTSNDARTGCQPDGAKARPSSGFVSWVCRKIASAMAATFASFGFRAIRVDRAWDRPT